MRKRYLFSVVLAIIILAVCLVPYVDGYFFKSNYLNFLSSLEQSTNGAVKIQVQEYHLGWLKSHVKLTIISTNKLVVNSLPQGVTVDNEIMHGPIVYNPVTNHYMLAFAAINGDTYLPSDLQQKLQGANNGAPFMQVRGVVSFDNKWTQKVTISPFTMPGKGRVSIQDSYADSTFAISDNKVNQIKAKGSIGAIRFEPSAENAFIPNISIAPVSLSEEMDFQQAGIWNSHGVISTPDISLQWLNGKVTTLNKFNLSTSKGLNSANLYDSKLHLAIDDIRTTASQFPEISPLTFDMAIKNIDPSGLQKYADYLKSYKQGAMTAEDLTQLQDLLLNIITPTSSLDIDLSSNTTQGALVIKCNSTIQNNGSKPATFNDMLNDAVINVNIRIAAPLLNMIIEKQLSMELSSMAAMPQMMNAPAGTTAGVSPAAIAEQRQRMIDMWMTSGYLTKANNDYVVIINVKNKGLTINGKSMAPLMPMPGMVPGMMPGPVMPPVPGKEPGMMPAPIPAPMSVPVPAPMPDSGLPPLPPDVPDMTQ